MKNITPKNNKGQAHGFWEIYFPDGKLWNKGNFVNGEKHGYWEWYQSNGKISHNGNYDMGKEVAYDVLIEPVITSEMFPIF